MSSSETEKHIASLSLPPGGTARGARRYAKIVLPILTVAAAGILELRVLVTGPVSAWPFPVREALPGLLMAGALAHLAFVLPSRKRRPRSPFHSDSYLLGILLSLWAVFAGAADMRAGLEPWILMVSVFPCSVLYWNRPRFLRGMLAVSAAVLAALEFAWSDAPRPELFFMLAAIVSLGISMGIVVRKSVLPSKERLESLELENKELWNLSFRDGLTGLYNKRYAEETSAGLFARFTRYHEPVHVLMIDIDHFKRVNDTYGHAVGDEVLKNVALIVQSCLRSSDIVARFGGEEFIVFAVHSEPELVQFIANRIRDAVAAQRFDPVPWTVTISIGVAGIKEGDTMRDLVDRADKFLYVSKQGGRNRVSGS